MACGALGYPLPECKRAIILPDPVSLPAEHDEPIHPGLTSAPVLCLAANPAAVELDGNARFGAGRLIDHDPNQLDELLFCLR